MISSISNNVWSILICSCCGHELARKDNGAECLSCGINYDVSPYNSLDLRLKKNKKYNLEFELGNPHILDDLLQVEPLITNMQPEVNFSKKSVPRNLTKAVLSYFPKAKGPGSLMLDLGCGNAIHKEVCEYAGFEWVGLDYDSQDALILGDAHSLPFKDGSFEFILFIAVLHLIRFPFVMMREAFRVLKPQGKLIGTVAFLEPFQTGSFYHHSHLGTINSLLHGGFTVEKIAPSVKWSSLVAQASMGLFPRMPRFLSSSIIYPINLLHKLWWHAGSIITPRASKFNRIRNNTGAFTFIAKKNSNML